ncbi:polyprenyl synthetase family protein [Mobilitalea sibirica]|uniref:Polyprenyl synthetase family protein n=1 Tax=Mobilitalea sibirica TaxID=1462919 RepID=A0A8J7H1R0_9FIRM|nr:polyprenyl synthetase family protein [Mobilitalea sibirica]MBH1940412.1 polyprenyl synthetase family protein [Mobilitalea sibirica]
MINNNSKQDLNTEMITIDEAIRQVKLTVDKTLNKSPLIIREFTKHLALSKGKFIRAYSVIMCAEDKDGMVHPNAVKIAAAIEILHLATLVHDDIIDDADLRRGQATLQKKYGKRTAVICGDYLLSVSLRMVASISNKKEYLDLEIHDYVGRVCLGELNQHINSSNVNLSIYQYLKIISGKTAALFEASFLAGAIFSKATEAERNRYKQLGFYIGMIFQLTDDCIDFENTVETANKPVQSDYEHGVITLPLINALQKMGDLKAKALDKGITRSEINDAVEKTGGLEFTRMVVKKYYNKSMGVIDRLDLSDSKKERLTLLLNKASRLS